jgi:hypothetical protein
MATADLLLNILAVDKASATLGGVGKSMSDLESRTKKLSSAASLIGTGAVIAFGAASIRTFSAVQDSTSALEATYGTAAEAFKEFATGQAIGYNLSQREALAAQQTFANFAKAAGLSGEQLQTFSIDLTKRAADMASYFGGTTSEAIEAVGAALRGETEPIRKYGVLLDDATMRAKAMELGLISSTKNALTPQQKVLAAQALILEKTNQVTGDTARTQDSLANQTKQAAAQFENFQTVVGQTLAVGVGPMLKALNSVMQAFGNLPQPIQTTGVAIAGVAAAALFLGPRIITLGTFIAGLLPAGTAAAAGLTAEAGAATAAGTASAAATPKIAMLGKALGPIAIGITATIAAMEGWQFVLDRIGAGADKVNDLADAMKSNNTQAVEASLKAYQAAQATGSWQSALGVLVATGGAGFPLIIQGFKNAGDATSNLDQQLSLMVTNGQAQSAADIIAQLGLNADEAKDKFPEYTKAVGENKKATADYSVILDDAGDSSLSFMDAVGKMADKERTAFDITKELAQAASDLKTALDELGGKAIGVDAATAGLEQAYDDAAEAVKKMREETDKATDAVNGNGTALDLTTPAGRTARDVLESIATKADTVAESMDTAGASTSSVKDAMATARAEFIQNAIDMGLNEKAANALADSYGLIPEDIATEVQIKKDAEAKAKAEEVRRTIGLIPENRRTVTVLPNADSAIAAAGRVRGAIVNIPETWTTTLIVVDQNGNNRRLPAATGGYIRGAGTGTSDSIPAMLSNGEYVIRAASVSRAGVALLDDLNDNGMIDNVAITAGSRSVVTGARDRAQAQSAEFWSHTVLQVDGKQLAESLVKYKRSIGNRPLGVS